MSDEKTIAGDIDLDDEFTDWTKHPNVANMSDDEYKRFSALRQLIQEERRKKLDPLRSKIKESLEKTHSATAGSGFDLAAQHPELTTQLKNDLKSKELELGKAEGVRDIHVGKFRRAQRLEKLTNLMSKAAKYGAMALPAAALGLLAGEDDAEASTEPTISQSNPEFSNTSGPPTEDTFDPPALIKRHPAKVIGESGLKVLEQVDKYTGRPTRVALLAAIQAENPYAAAKRSITDDEDVEGKEVARALLGRIEGAGMPLRAPGQKESALETPLGLGIDFAADPSNLSVGAGALKLGKLLKLIK